VTTRYYSRWQKKFFFADTTPETRAEFLAMKVYWLSGVLGEKQPVWIADPRDAQYLNTTSDELGAVAAELLKDEIISLKDGWAAATPKLMDRGARYKNQLTAAIATTKPTFNEEMRAGHTNM